MKYVPEPEDLDYLTKISMDFHKKTSALFEKPSPSLPLHFDKSYLPKNICEPQYINLFECVTFRSTDLSSSCSYEISRFENCRKDRDIKILSGIKQWESRHIQELDSKNRQFYLQGLTFKLDRLKDDYSKVPSTQAKQYKLVQIESEINQIKWRMKYIRQIIKTQPSTSSTPQLT